MVTRAKVDQAEARKAFVSVFGESFYEKFEDPVVFHEVTLSSPSSQRMYRRDFKLTSRSAFCEYMFRRVPGYDESVLNRWVEVCGAKLQQVEQLLKLTIQRLEKIFDDQGFKPESVFMHPETHVVPVIHSVSLQYLHVLELLDRLYDLTGAGAIEGILSSEGRKEAELKCRRAVRAVTSVVRQETTNMRREATRLKTLQSGKASSELQEADALTGAVVADMDSSEREEGGAMADPAAVLQGLVANEKAVAEVERRAARAVVADGATAPATV